MLKTLWRWRNISEKIDYKKKLRALKTKSHIYAANHFETLKV